MDILKSDLERYMNSLFSDKFYDVHGKFPLAVLDNNLILT